MGYTLKMPNQAFPEVDFFEVSQPFLAEDAGQAFFPGDVGKVAAQDQVPLEIQVDTFEDIGAREKNCLRSHAFCEDFRSQRLGQAAGDPLKLFLDLFGGRDHPFPD